MKHLKKTAAKLDDYGRNGDTIVAHINPREAALLKALGGSASINPKTGLPEFFSESDPMGSGSDYGYDGGRTDADRAASENATNSMVGAMNAAATAPMYEEDAQKAQYQPRSFFTRARDWAVAQPREFVEDLRDKPFETIGNFAFNMATGGVPSMANSFSGMVGGPTVGGAMASAGRGIGNSLGFGGPETQVADVSGKTTGALADNTGPSGDKTDGPDKSGEGGDGIGSTNPFGSANSPLFKALLEGYMPTKDPWGNMGRRKTYGALTSSFSPYGREYVTPWAYRG